ncbi:hypothetical protein B0J14DRAFT_556684 [Halenospora varia]|nr:hypothetical protein B0J14DRAFT_556684 [Halenospora varia]
MGQCMSIVPLSHPLPSSPTHTKAPPTSRCRFAQRRQHHHLNSHALKFSRCRLRRNIKQPPPSQRSTVHFDIPEIDPLYNTEKLQFGIPLPLPDETEEDDEEEEDIEKRMSRMSTFGSTWIPPMSWECLSPTISCYEKMRKENEEEVMGSEGELTPERELDEWSKQRVKEGGFYVDPSVVSEEGRSGEEKKAEMEGEEMEFEKVLGEEQKTLGDSKRPTITSPFIDGIPSTSSESIPPPVPSLEQTPRASPETPVAESSGSRLPFQDDAFGDEVEPKTLIIPH